MLLKAMPSHFTVSEPLAPPMMMKPLVAMREFIAPHSLVRLQQTSTRPTVTQSFALGQPAWRTSAAMTDKLAALATCARMTSCGATICFAWQLLVSQVMSILVVVPVAQVSHHVRTT
jgi:hypothetical protein